MRTKTGVLGLVVAGLVIGSLMASGVVRADDAPVKKHHHHHHIHGRITAVSATSITIMAHKHHKKGEAAAAPESKTFTINDKTKIEHVAEDGTKSTISVSDLKEKEHVSIEEITEGTDHVAKSIVAGHHRHHKKKPVA